VSEARLSVRVDSDVKERAESIFKGMGLTLSAGVSAFLYRVVQDQAIPFTLAVKPPKSASIRTLEDRARAAVEDAESRLTASGAPVALYDADRRRPYLRYPDGRTDYDL
jgi:DNA-damage-inducible protein J